MIVPEIQHDFPNAIYLILLIIPIIFLLWKLEKFRKESVKNYTEGEPSPILIAPSIFRRIIKYSLLCAAWLFLVIALMQPKGNPRHLEEIQERTTESSQLYNSSKINPHEVTFLLDVSPSMGVKDAYLKQTRLEYSKEVIDKVIKSLDGESVALDVFTDQYNPLSPPTIDHLFVRMLLRGIEINEGNGSGTDILNALEKVYERYSQEPLGLSKTLILFSDGGDPDFKNAEDQQKKTSFLKTLSQTENINLKIMTIGIGSTEGGVVPNILYEGKPVISKLNPEALKLIVQDDRGEYISAQNLSNLMLASKIERFINLRSQDHERSSILNLSNSPQNIIYDYYFQYPLAFGIILLIFALTIPEGKNNEE
jgi:Ca-activated chloride channel family protein